MITWVKNCIKNPLRCHIFLLSALLFMATGGCGGGGGGGGDNPPGTSTVTLSGTISAPSGVVIDSDVNDPNETYTANDSIETAQPLVNPVSVGGYVNVAFTGETGRSFSSGDREDYFQVQCNAGDTISLSTGDPDAGDLDLYLLNTFGDMIDNSIGSGQFESVTAPSDDTYVVRVYASSGASNYILVIGAAASTSAGSEADTLSTRYEFVPGQAILRFKNAVHAAKAGNTLQERAKAMGMTLSARAGDREMLATFDDTDTQTVVSQALRISRGPSWRQSASGPDLERKMKTLERIKALRKHRDILSAEPNYILHHSITEPNDTYYGLQWHYPQINLPQAWDFTTGDSDVIVAVIDSGVLMNHPDLNNRLTDTGFDFISSTSISNDGDGIDDDPDDPGNTTTGTSSFHGTHCAGTVAAETNNSSGLAGVTWNTQIMPVRILGVGGGTLYDLMQGIRYAAGLNNDSGITLNATQRADIISMSLGGGGYSVSTQNVINQARSAGVIIIAAAGNESNATPFYPASYDGVISVSAVNINGTLASYSNYGSNIDVAAPGGDAGDYDGDGYADYVWSTCGNDSSGSIQYNYVAYYGTSMATPHVAGVVALMKSLDPALTPTGLDTLLSSGAITNDIGNTGRDDYYGHGLIDALKAVLAVNSGDVPTALNVDPTTVNFGTSSTSATVMVSKIGSDAISVADVSADENWLSVFATSVDGDGLGSYTLQADRTGLSDGTHLATATFTSSLGSSVTVQVSLQVSSANVAYDAGYHYVRLIDANDHSILAQDNVQASGSTYAYAFSNVPQGGTYMIMAGSDRDNDGNIDNPAESRGAYLSLDQIIYVEANGNLSGLDFATDLKLTISTSGLSTEPD